MHKKLTLYTCFCTPRSQLSNCLQKSWRECIAQLSFGSAVAAVAARKQDAKIRTGAQEGTSKGCFLEAVGKVWMPMLIQTLETILNVAPGKKSQIDRPKSYVYSGP